MTAPSETPLTENIQKLADDLSVKCGVATVQAAIRIYLRQLAPHAKEREGGVLLEKALEQMEVHLVKINLLETALAESRAEADKQRQIAANWENLAAMHKAERDEARAEDLSLRMEGAERWNAIHITEIAALKQRAEGLAKDAERYRWLRDEESHVEKVNIEWLTAPHGDALDAIIDAAIAGSCE
jgi:thiamine kinase-like enzyme